MDDGPVPGTGVSSRPTLGAYRRQSAPPEGGVPTGPPPTDDAATPSDPPTNGPTAGPEAAGPPGDPGSEPSVTPPGPPPSSGPFPTRDQLVQAWGDHVIGRLRPKAKALFQAGRFVGVEGDRAVFGLPNETHRTRCEEVRGEIEAALSEQFGLPVGVELVVDPGSEAPRSHSGAPTGGDDEDATPVSGRSSKGATGTPPAAASSDRSAPVAPRIPAGGSPRPNGRADPDERHSPDDQEDHGDLSVFDEEQLGEIAVVDNSAEARVLQAFPGAEEVG